MHELFVSWHFRALGLRQWTGSCHLQTQRLVFDSWQTLLCSARLLSHSLCLALYKGRAGAGSTGLTGDVRGWKLSFGKHFVELRVKSTRLRLTVCLMKVWSEWSPRLEQMLEGHFPGAVFWLKMLKGSAKGISYDSYETTRLDAPEDH